MSLADLGDGESVFLDANIFIYHFAGRSLQCKALLERCARRKLQGYTSTSVLAEVLHRLMVAEAIEKGLVTAKAAVKQLTKYDEDVRKIGQMNLTILSLTLKVLARSSSVRKTEGLLTNDSLVVAVMQEQGLTKLATTDRDFERVAGLEVYKPTDL